MNLTTTARHFKLTPAIEAYAKGKFEKVWGHFEIISAQLRLVDGDGGMRTAQADIQIKGKTLHIEEADHNLYAAIDKLVDASHHALKRVKEKRSEPRGAERLSAQLAS